MSGRTFVIGDLHGCTEELDRLLDTAQPDSGDTVCCLGDYVDRGPSPHGIIERLIRLQREGPECIFLKGNHEDMFLDFIGYGGHHGESFHWNGGEATLASYGLSNLPGPDVAERLPPDHRDFLLGLRNSATIGRFLCVHAGVRPTRPLDAQDVVDLFWIREEFIAAPHPFPYTVLYGHTPRREVHVDLPFKIGLDTGLVYGNRLSCLELSERELLQVSRGADHVERRSLAAEFAAAGL